MIKYEKEIGDKMSLIQEMELYAKEHNVPIMQKDGVHFLCDFINEHKCTRILEIGSAIGYSAICMAMLANNLHITTIERDKVRYQKAVEYVNKSGLSSQIHIIHGDALDMDIDGMFDLLFIDAAKAQYIKFFEKYEKNVKKNGYIITDNLSFHGFVENKDLVKSKNLRQLVGKIQRFIDYLQNRADYDTIFLEKGDGIGISRKK